MGDKNAEQVLLVVLVAERRSTRKAETRKIDRDCRTLELGRIRLKVMVMSMLYCCERNASTALYCHWRWRWFE